MKVKTLINRLLDYDMEHNVELIILGVNEERYTCILPDDCIEEGNQGGNDYCPLIFATTEIKDDDESIEDLIEIKERYAK